MWWCHSGLVVYVHVNWQDHIFKQPWQNINAIVWLICYAYYHAYIHCHHYQTWYDTLKLPSLFVAWLCWTFHTKSHNMKALVILSHSWTPFLPLTCLYGKNELLWASGVFSWEKPLPRLSMQVTLLWPPVGRFNHGLITINQKKMWTCQHKVLRLVFVYISLSTCKWVHMTLAINRPDILLM